MQEFLERNDTQTVAKCINKIITYISLWYGNDEKNMLPKADILSKNVSLLLMIVTAMESVASVKIISALYLMLLKQLSVVQ